MVTILQEFFSIKSRLNRKKFIMYWFFVSFFPLAFLFVTHSINSYIINLAGGLCLLLGLISHICLAIRRLHDVERHGAMVLILFIPFFNLFLTLYLFTFKGTEGYNFYGPDRLESVIEFS